MPNPDKPEPTMPPRGDGSSSQPDPDDPLLQPDDEADLAEGESELTFISRRPRPGSDE